MVELRRPDNSGPDLGVEPGTALQLPGGVRVTLLEAFPTAAGPPGSGAPAPTPGPRRRPSSPGTGSPSATATCTARFPLADYQNVYATEPGSAEMASAGRPFTDRLLVRLMARGIPVVPLILHTGVSSPELHEPPYPERFAVPEVTARLVDQHPPGRPPRGRRRHDRHPGAGDRDRRATASRARPPGGPTSSSGPTARRAA